MGSRVGRGGAFHTFSYRVCELRIGVGERGLDFTTDFLDVEGGHDLTLVGDLFESDEGALECFVVKGQPKVVPDVLMEGVAARMFSEDEIPRGTH